jgi:hypothetical protein
MSGQPDIPDSQPAASADGIQSIPSDTDMEPPDLVISISLDRWRQLTGTPARGSNEPGTEQPWDYCRLIHEDNDFGVEIAWETGGRTEATEPASATANECMRVLVTAFKCNMCQTWSPYPKHFRTGARHAAENRIRQCMNPLMIAGQPADDHTITCSLCDMRQPLRLSKHFLSQIIQSNAGSYLEEAHTLTLMDCNNQPMATGRARMFKYADHPDLTCPVQTVAAAYNRLALELQQAEAHRERSRSRTARPQATKQASDTAASPPRRASTVKQVDLTRWFSPRQKATDS